MILRVRKNAIFEAIRYDGTNASSNAIGEWLGQRMRLSTRGEPYIQVCDPHDRAWIIVYEGDYVFFDGYYASVVSPVVFDLRYEVVE